MKLGIFTSLFLISIQLAAQNFGDPSHYLIDSVEVSELSEPDSSLIESSLIAFHNSKSDTAKIRIINSLVEECYDDKIWPRYNNWEYDFVTKALTKNDNPQIKARLLKYKAATLNNKGFFLFSQGNSQPAMDFFLEALAILEQLNEPEDLASLLNNISSIYHQEGKIKKAIKYHHKTLKLRFKENDQEGIAQSLNNVGYLFYSQGDISRAINCYMMSIKIDEELKNTESLAVTYSNLGLVYEDQGDEEQAFIYYNKSLNLHRKNGNKGGAAKTLNNLGTLYESKGEYQKALDLYLKSKAIKETLNDPTGLAYSLNNIGVIYFRLSDYQKAQDYHQQSLDIYESLKNRVGIANALSNIGHVHLKNHNTTKAIQVGLKCINISKELGMPDQVKKAAQLLSLAYGEQNKGMEAYEMLKLYMQMRDSLNNIETQRVVAKGQAKYAYEKQKVLDDVGHEKKLILEQEKKEKREIVIYFVVLCLIIIGSSLVLIFKRLKVTRKQKVIIERAHDELEEKNREITDSIIYAKRIQTAILPQPKLVKEYLKDSFILYKPKDIVAGDFYWLEHHEGKILFAAADCTGHGVPGAMVSVICNNGLNRSVREHGLSDPGKILDKTREIVIQEFEKSEEEVKDGMDIALCSLKGYTLEYAGAHNPLWLIRNGQIIVIKADRQPIGRFDKQKPFTTHSLELQHGDVFYIFSDGYVDQFGGEKGKKLKAKAFREMLLSIQDKSMEDQRIIIDEKFEKWKGNLEQIDDVCIIGVRI